MFWCDLGCFNGLHDGYANSEVKIKFANEFASRHSPTDSQTVLLRAVG